LTEIANQNAGLNLLLISLNSPSQQTSSPQSISIAHQHDKINNFPINYSHFP
jgi:hypothetical protein